MLKRVTPGDIRDDRSAVDEITLARAGDIVRAVRQEGDAALRRFGSELDALDADTPLLLGRDALDAALASVSLQTRELLERTKSRIQDFARAQRDALTDMEVAISGGRAGHRITPLRSAGCYAPGGRYPLPSSVLMTVVPARVAGVQRVVVASPNPAPVTLAAAAVAGADAVITVGGAHAVAALAYGSESIAPVDVVVGPGSRWVTAAKQLVYGRVGIDMLAGPSELVVLADSSAEPATIAADLLAQAEHAPDALPYLVVWDASVADAVDRALTQQLTTLPTANVARAALANGAAVVCSDRAEAVALCNRLAPEHLQVMTADPRTDDLQHYGALFVGEAAEVLGDYGAGPNHVLPTGASARFTGGLSVLTFVAVRSWIRVDDRREAASIYTDAAALARLEGLPAHAHAAERRL